jgi:hypothetical protein
MSGPVNPFLVPAGAGETVHAHCFANVGADPARILVMFTPAGLERFFEGIATLEAGPDGRLNPDAYRAVAHSASMQVLGPPLSQSDRQ